MRAIEKRSNKIICHNESTPSACATKCTKLWIIEHCGCIPFSTRTGLAANANSNLPYCDSEIYAACEAWSMPNSEKETCNRKCKKACEYTSYNWQATHKSYETDKNVATEFKLRVKPLFDTFPEFSWTTKYKPEQVLSQAGGLLNFYLGLSGLSLFAFIISFIDLIKGIRSKSRQNDQREETVESGGRSTVFRSEESSRPKTEFSHFENFRFEDKWIYRLKAEIRAELKAELKTELKA